MKTVPGRDENDNIIWGLTCPECGRIVEFQNDPIHTCNHCGEDFEVIDERER